MKVMVVDDEPAQVRGIIRYMDWENLGYEKPVGFTDEQAALETLKGENFDVVITDIKMPRIGGLELIRRIHALGMDADIVIISGIDEFPYAQEAIRLGVCAYLLKPLKTEELEECLKSVRSRRLERGLKSVRRAAGKETSSGKICHPSVKRVMQYVNENYGKELTIKGLAEFSGMNADYLSALFKKETGINLNGYITATRLKEAHKILEETDCRINEVAFRVGYSTPGYFSEQFRAFYGYTPSEVRKRNAESKVTN